MLNLLKKAKAEPKYSYKESLEQASLKALARVDAINGIGMDILEITPRTFRVRPVDPRSENKGKRKVWRVRFMVKLHRPDGSTHWIHQAINTERYLALETQS